ncbi:MAG: NUDIX hydrolase [Phyllobacterium sp.]
MIDENTIIPIKDVAVRVVDEPLHYEIENRDSIEQGWDREYARNPHLFNGPLYLAETAELSSGLFQATFQRTRYATLLHWRKDISQQRPWHIFGVGVIVSADNCLIAGRMAPRNAVAGRIYFPAGSIDDNDVVDGMVDYDRNMLREVAEETGFDLTGARRDTALHLVKANRNAALFRRFFFDLGAAEIAASIRAHIAADDAAELDDVIVVSGAGQMGDATPSYVRAFADWHFGSAP